MSGHVDAGMENESVEYFREKIALLKLRIATQKLERGVWARRRSPAGVAGSGTRLDMVLGMASTDHEGGVATSQPGA